MSALPSLARSDRAVGADAAEALCERYRSRIFAFCLSRLGNREEAEDATQTTFLNAFRSLHGGLVPRFELAWLFRIADNVCRDWRKSAWRRGRVETTRDLHELQDVVSAPDRRSDGLVGLDSALAGMPDRQREAILLREWQGLSYDEIAAKLGLSKAAVETLLFRARRSLARGLDAPQAQPRRARAGCDVASLLGPVKSLLCGAGAAKVAATAAVVAGAGAVFAAAPLRDSRTDAPPQRTERDLTAVTDLATRVPPISRVVQRPAVSGRGERHSVRAERAPAGRSSYLPRSDVRTAAPPTKTTAPPSRPQTTNPEPPARTANEPAPEIPAPAPPPAPVAPPASLPNLAPAPPVPPVVPEVPPLEPPALPPVPDAPVDVPDLPKLP